MQGGGGWGGQEGGYGQGYGNPYGGGGGWQGGGGQMPPGGQPYGVGEPGSWPHGAPGQFGVGPPQPGYVQQGSYNGQPMQMTPPAPAGAFSPNQGPVAGRRKALICGNNYAGTSAQLGGCINDAKCMAYLLQTKFGFREEDMRVLTDDQTDSRQRPTRDNMLGHMRWLVEGAQPGDSLVFHFSGHGSQVSDHTGEERDSMNETICPCDFQEAGMIVDDELNAYLINPLQQGVRLHAIIDACHSGTVLDLPYSASVQNAQPSWNTEYAHPTRVYKGTAGGLAVQFGAATDQQTAADTAQLSGSVSTGAATFSFIQAIEHIGTHISYGQLLHEMHRTLKTVGGGSQAATSASGVGGVLGSLGKKLLSGQIYNTSSLVAGVVSAGVGALGARGNYKAQTPVMSSNEAFDMNRPIAF